VTPSSWCALLGEIDGLVIKRYPVVLGAGIPFSTTGKAGKVSFELVDARILRGGTTVTAGVLSGVDGALRVVERMVGQAAAAKAARAVAWPAYHRGGPAAIRRSRPAPTDVVGLLSAGYRWDRPTTGAAVVGIQIVRRRRSEPGGDHATTP
jgi:hypothetical protein